MKRGLPKDTIWQLSQASNLNHLTRNPPCKPSGNCIFRNHHDLLFAPCCTSHKSALNFFIYGKSHLPNCKNSCRISWGPFFSLSRSWSLLALSCSTNSFRDKWFHISVVVFVVIIVGTFCTTASQLSSYVQTSPTFTLQITKFRFFLLFSFILCTSPAEYRFK